MDDDAQKWLMVLIFGYYCDQPLISIFFIRPASRTLCVLLSRRNSFTSLQMPLSGPDNWIPGRPAVRPCVVPQAIRYSFPKKMSVTQTSSLSGGFAPNVRRRFVVNVMMTSPSTITQLILPSHLLYPHTDPHPIVFRMGRGGLLFTFTAAK